MSTTNESTNPRPSDVARWVATLAKPYNPKPSFDREASREDRRRKNARNMLAHHGLDAQGNPKPAAVAS